KKSCIAVLVSQIGRACLVSTSPFSSPLRQLDHSRVAQIWADSSMG
ncbi:unnamed protein product, partial [Musa acuminata subsp. malaccensis]